ncbi:YHYH protein [Alteromonas sp. C1M14]|uniref:YHYH protein n=1 Tax=Alteromonas sp. C1M14 TaxID=2841567 RepID=UPI001C087522|nr:YHYH protein [Alteromonas sp. C1M14]MBU2976810.1 YHYH protein [Alteromonas sp. C1M14]
MNTFSLISGTVVCSTLLVACGGSDSSNTSLTEDTSTESDTVSTDVGPDISLFLSDGLAEEISTEDCTLSDGTNTTCYRITVAGVPANTDIGPFCPRYITDDETAGGIWFDGSGELYSLSGEFIENISDIYGDDWLLYDPATGEVNVTDTQTACEAAARPNVDEAYQNHCVECDIAYYNGGVSQTFLIPTTPSRLANPDSAQNNIGVTLNGVLLAGPAPVDAILSANTIAAFDDCGGHVNPADGYHYHAATGCSEVVTEVDGHANLMGYALDGYGIYGMLDAAGEESYDLDECRGHEDDTRGYHYHTASAAENMFIGCFSGAQAN